jgi:hypothetical protein
MELNIASEVAALQRMSIGQLRLRYGQTFGEPTNARNRHWLIRRIAWRLQALAEGDLSERARQRAAELAQDADLRLFAPQDISWPSRKRANVRPLGQAADHRLPPAGSVIARDYKGKQLLVTVLPVGFQYEGHVFRSLSAVAAHITGSHCNGFLFFGLAKGGTP